MSFATRPEGPNMYFLLQFTCKYQIIARTSGSSNYDILSSFCPRSMDSKHWLSCFTVFRRNLGMCVRLCILYETMKWSPRPEGQNLSFPLQFTSNYEIVTRTPGSSNFDSLGSFWLRSVDSKHRFSIVFYNVSEQSKHVCKGMALSWLQWLRSIIPCKNYDVGP